MFKLILTKLYNSREWSWKLKYEEQQINNCVLWATDDNCECCDIDFLKFDENLGDDSHHII